VLAANALAQRRRRRIKQAVVLVAVGVAASPVVIPWVLATSFSYTVRSTIWLAASSLNWSHEQAAISTLAVGIVTTCAYWWNRKRSSRAPAVLVKSKNV